MADVTGYAYGSQIFKSRRVLTDEYVPTSLRVRREEAELLTRRLLLKLIHGPVTNDITLIYGSSGVVGVGKTMLAKYSGMRAVEEARKRGINAIYIHVNVYGSPSIYTILKAIVAQLDPRIPVHGVSAIDVLREIVYRLYRDDMYMILTIDEFQSMLAGKIDDASLYQLLRLYEQIPPPDGVSRIIYILVAMDLRVLSQLKERLPQIESQIAYRIHMMPYNAEELYQILEQRAEEGLQPGTWTPYLLQMIAEEVAMGTHGGSARKAINVLRTAAENAEALGLSTITESLVRHALAETQVSLISVEELSMLNKHEALMLLALAKLIEQKGNYATTGEIAALYQQLAENYGIKPLGHSQFHERLNRVMSSLANSGLVDYRRSGKGIRGRTTLYRLAPSIPADRLVDVMERIVLPRILGG
ncbi:MAG: AAA family ATPase [Desulfurococcales archaeon]|nr:AAA family ATPase [Desulfurococcales archaeon]